MCQTYTLMVVVRIRGSVKATVLSKIDLGLTQLCFATEMLRQLRLHLWRQNDASQLRLFAVFADAEYSDYYTKTNPKNGENKFQNSGKV